MSGRLACLVTAAVLLAASVKASDVSCVSPPLGLISWWRAENSPLDEVSSNHGSVVGKIGYAIGMVQRGFAFDGISRDRLDLGSPTNLHLQEFSIEAWIKRSSATDISQDDLGEDGSLTGEGGFLLSCGHGGYGFGLLDDGRLMLGKLDESQVTGPGVADTNWHHIAVTKRGTNVTFYVDGIGTGASSYDAAFDFSSRIALGSRGDGLGGTLWGMIDELAIYSRALMPDEIQGIYAAGCSGKCVEVLPPGMGAGVFSLDDGSAEAFGGTPGGDLLALNHFDTGGRTVLIDQISVLWNPISRSVSPTVALYADADDSGNPSNAVPLLIYPIEIPAGVVILNSGGPQDYSVPPTVVSGSFFVGAFLSDRESGFDPGIGINVSHSQPNQSWVLENSSGPGSMDLENPAATSTLVEPLDNVIRGNHVIRARYTVVPSCVSPPVGLISWWRAENSPLDAFGVNHGSVVGRIGYANGVVQRAFVIDGLSRNRLDLGNPTNLQLQDFSIEAWIERSSATDISLDDLGEDGSVTGEGGFVLSYGHGGYGFGLLDDGRLMLGKLDESQVTGPGVSDTNWHHIAVTKRGTNVTFYVDGIGTGASSYDATFDFSSRIALGSRGDAQGGTFWGMIDELTIYNRALTPAQIQGIYAAGGSGKCVHTPSLPPAITSQPEEQVKPLGGIATLAVVVTGTAPLQYQWFFDGNAMVGKTNAAFTLTNLQPEQSGPYFVIVTNLSGSVTSSTARLSIAATSAPVCVAVPDGAVAWWRAESNTVDSVGINDGFFFGGDFYLLPFYTQGLAGTCFRFLPRYSVRLGGGATNNYLSVPASADLDLGHGAGLTLEGWIRPDSLTNVQPLLEWNDGAGNIGAGLNLNKTALEASLTDTNSTPTSRIVLRSPAGILVTSFWQHVALTFDQAAGSATVYLNGTAVGQTNFGSFIPQTQAPVYLGYRVSGAQVRAWYSGRMDEMTIYNHALSPDEIRAIVTADSAGKCPPPPPSCLPPPRGLVGWWRGESNMLDSVDSNHGVRVGPSSSLTYSNAVVGRGFHFSGGYVQVPGSSNLNVGTGPGLTLETWVLPSPANSINWYVEAAPQ